MKRSEMIDTISFVILMDAPVAMTEEEAKALASQVVAEIEKHDSLKLDQE